MKRVALIGVVAVGAFLVWMVPHLSQPVIGHAASLEAPHIGEGGLPQFELDPSFPKIPAQWRTGFGGGVAVDPDDNVWLLTRPHTLPHPTTGEADLTSTPAPPVMEFDKDGNFIRGWGGQSGPGYQWPSNEHSVTVDFKGFVWILGNADTGKQNPANLPNDNQILKFTKDGKLVMAIGKSGQTGSNATEVLRGATAIAFYDKTHELFVSDGYGNSRVMVYDADTGKFKRMWGAYGNKPLDVAARPPAPVGGPITPMPIMYTVWHDLQQFDIPHDVLVSSDGLVYLDDRQNRRIQVFTIDGTFIAEQFISLGSRYPLQAMSITFSPDERFLYVAGTPVIRILNRKTLEVLGSFVDTPLLAQPGAHIIPTGQIHPLGHTITTDHEGNVYAIQAELNGVDGKRLRAVIEKFVFKGYSPKISCPPCQPTRSAAETVYVTPPAN